MATTEHEIVTGKHGPDVVCRAPKGAYCHLRCSTGTCECWGGDECLCGPLVERDECNAAEWISAAGIEDCGPEGSPAFDEDGELTYRGPISIEWDDGYHWDIADQTDAKD
jgi:hypothetical protein